MEKHIIDEKTGISYTLQGDYYIPDLTLPPEKEYPPLGKYGRMRLTYLKEHKKSQYSIMLMNGAVTTSRKTRIQPGSNPIQKCRTK